MNDDGAPSLFRQVVGGYHQEKKTWDRTYPWIFFVARPISFLVTPPLMAFSVTANQVTAASGIVALISLACFVTGGPGWAMAGALLLLVFSVLDCVDGNIARARPVPGPPVGRFLDQSMTHYYFLTYFCLALGWRAHAQVIFSEWLVALGALCSLCKYVSAFSINMFWNNLAEHWTAHKETTDFVPHTGQWYYNLYYNLTDPQALVFLWPLVIIFGWVEVFLMMNGLISVAQVVIVLTVFFRRALKMRQLD